MPFERSAERAQTLASLQGMHSHLILAIVQRYGLQAAMHILGTTLQWLATMPVHGNAQLRPTDEPSSPRVRVEKSTIPSLRWKISSERALATTDPWAQHAMDLLPIERAQRRRWVGASDAGVSEGSTSLSAWQSDEVLVRVERHEFARGAMRHCYRLKLRTACCLSWRRDLNLVAKRYEPASTGTLEADVQMQMRAKWYSAAFNARGVPKPVDFVSCEMIEIKRDPDPAVFAVESFVEGEFTKYSSNGGYVTDEVLRSTPHAFSHFTFERSDGREVVVDIQGVGDLYTDPQIHSLDGEGFGRGNMGTRGITLFFASHRCNGICRMLGLTPFAQPATHGSGTLTATSARLPITRASSFDQIVELAPPPSPHSALLLSSLSVPDESPQPMSAAVEVWDPSPPSRVASLPTRHAPIHYALALLHARHVHAGDDVFGPGLFASPASGLFHLRRSAQEGHVAAMLALACLLQGVKPRKGVLRALGQALQRPLPIDARSATRYTELAAERGVVSAMAAVAFAYRHGVGVPASPSTAARFYRSAINAINANERGRYEDEDAAERLPGGDASESAMLTALAEIHEVGGEPRLARQFELLARSSARRDLEEVPDEGSSSTDEPDVERETVGSGRAHRGAD